MNNFCNEILMNVNKIYNSVNWLGYTFCNKHCNKSDKI